MAKFISFFSFLSFTMLFTVLSLFDLKIVDNYLNSHIGLRPIIGIILGVFLLFIAIGFLKSLLLFHINYKHADTLTDKKIVRKESYKFYFSFTVYTMGVFIIQIFSYILFHSSSINLIISFVAFLLTLPAVNKYSKYLKSDEKILLISQLPFPINKIIVQLIKVKEKANTILS